MKKRVALAAVFGLAILLGWRIARQRMYDPSGEFVRRWAEIFERHPDLASIQAMDPNEYLYVGRFNDGTWVVASHDDGHGHSFDSLMDFLTDFRATVFYDSTGAIRYDTDYHFCGYEGLCGQLSGLDANTLEEFYSSLSQLRDLKLETWKAGRPPRQGQ
jgi:hypothetical protein